ncbi:MAG TPA: GAF domain-containing protein [Anaerolineales bacterium]|nr:GAF domain-containing protein [Anaerolineales bacterium]
MNAIIEFFKSPEDNDPSFIRLTRNILLFTLAATVISIGAVAGTGNSRALPVTVGVLIIAALLEGVALFQVLQGKLTLAKLLLPTILTIAITMIALSRNTIHDISVAAYPVIMIMATLLQGRRSLVVTTPLVVAAIALLGTVDMLGRGNSPISTRTGLDDILVGIVLVLLSAWILNLVVGRLRIALAKAEANEDAQEAANRALQELQATLEQRVEARTEELRQRGLELQTANIQVERRAAQLAALAQVMRTIISVHDLQELLPRIAGVVSEKFGFYHVGVFLIDEAGEYAILSAANSSGGQKMLARKHRLRVGEEGIVGFVTATGEPRIAMDVGKDPVFFNNPDLPETHSELALPLRIEQRVVGALDVQSQETAAFSNEDVQMLSLLADQVSLAIENARLFDETRTALAEAEAVSRQFIREAWSRVPTEHQLIGYRYSVAGAAPLQQPMDLKAQAATRAQPRSVDTDQVIVPILLRGETIGTLVVQSPSEQTLNQDQLDLIQAVAERVALSAENARLFEETTRRAERERLVSDITGKIRGTHDPQTMVQTAIDELRKALGASRVEVVPQSVQGTEEL